MQPRAPGVLVQEAEAAAPALLRLGDAGFVGQTERGPVHCPQLLTSWGQFTDVFGGFLGRSYLAYAVHGFFLNGGRRCWVVRTDTVQPGNGGKELLAGLAPLERVAEIDLVAIPDLVIPDLYGATPDDGDLKRNPFNSLREGQRELLRHCQAMGERFAILDAPPGARPGPGTGSIMDWADELSKAPEARNGALYYPWLRHRSAGFGGRELLLPPCGHLAGIYARSEEARGVGKAPANEVLQGVTGLEVCLDDADQAPLNELGINCLRALPGRGLRVWGARTLSRDAQWRYVNVRRIALAIVKQILVRLRWTVFEPNDARLRSAVTAALTLYLTRLFQRGELAGATAKEAFFVECNAQTNPASIVDLGQMVARVGFAPAKPAEFLVVTIRRAADALSVSEEA